MPKKGKRDKIQPVIPMDQIAIDENGNAVAKSVRPLTYALMTFIKCDLGMEDTIDISDDESEAQWQVSFSSEDSKHSFSAFIDTDENSGIIALNIYLDGHKFDLDENGGLPFIRFILDENLQPADRSVAGGEWFFAVSFVDRCGRGRIGGPELSRATFDFPQIDCQPVRLWKGRI